MVRVRQAGVEETLGWEVFEERVRSGRIAADAQLRIEAITGDRWVPAGTLELYQSLRNDEERAYKRQVSAAGPPVLTALLVGVQVQIWWLAHIPGVPVGRFIKETAAILEDGQVWRLLTMAFTQVDFGHLFGNVVFLALSGYALERALGWRNYLAIYLSAALGGSVASLLLSPWTASLGSSGAVLGCLAACTVFGVRYPELMPERMRSLYGLAVLPFLAITMLSGLLNDVTDNYCHAGGLVTGGIVAALLDPEGLERRPGYDRALRFGLGAAGAVLLCVAIFLGTRLEPLYDVAYARWAAVDPSERRSKEPPKPAEDALAYAVPAGWTPDRGLLGETGFVSPARRHRMFVVQESSSDVPSTPEAVVDARMLSLKTLFPSVVIEPPVPTTVAGRPGLSWRASVPERRLQLLGQAATRGRTNLEILWEGLDFDRVGALRDRLFAAVVWRPPVALREARAAVAKSPNSRVARAALADALVDTGEPSEGLDLWRSLVTELPEDEAAWVGLLRTIGLYPAQVADPQALVADALARNPAPRVIVEAATAERRLGRPETGDGLLDIAWGKNPGDRTIAAARPDGTTDLDAARYLPVDVTADPTTGTPRSEAEVERLLQAPLTLDAAAARGRLRADERDRLVGAAKAAIRGDDPFPALFALWRRRAPDAADRERYASSVRQDLLVVAAGESVPWLDPLADEIRARHAEDPAWP